MNEIIQKEIKENKLVVICGKGSNKVSEDLKGNPYFFQYPEHGLDPSEIAVRIESIIEISKTSPSPIIIHTHNDHVINGIMIQVYIKFKELKKEKPDLTKGISKDEVSILFIDNDNEIVKVPLTETGRIPKPPKGFFQQFAIDMRRLLTGE